LDRDFKQFFVQFRGVVWGATHWQLKKMSREIHDSIKVRYPASHKAYNDDVEHGFTIEEFRHLLKFVKDQEDRRCFIVMAALGLRPNELARLRGRDLSRGRILVPASKGGRSSNPRIPAALLPYFRAAEPGERLFLRTAKQLREAFSRYRQEAGFDEIYGWSRPCGHGAQNPRPLFRFSLKSFRHYGIQRIEALTNDPDLARRFGRQRRMEHTIKYFRKSRAGEVELALGDVVSPVLN
jgi:integrase